MKSVLLLVTIWSGLLVACSPERKAEPMPARTKTTVVTDSQTLVLAVQPTIDCLPLYYAAEKGLFKKVGARVFLKSYNSQADCDTAYINKSTDGGVTDLVRLCYHRNRGEKLEVISGTDNEWAVVVSGKLRIRNLTALKKHSIAISRFSAAHYLLTDLLKDEKITPTDILPVQINDYKLRTEMLDENQIDAAILSEPYVALAKSKGHHILINKFYSLNLGCIVLRKESVSNKLKNKQISLFIKAYNMAADSINKLGKNKISDILSIRYQLPEKAIDSLKLPHYRHVSIPERIDYCL